MEINKLEKALNLFPINVVGDPLLICLLKDTEIIKEPESLEKELVGNAIDVINSLKSIMKIARENELGDVENRARKSIHMIEQKVSHSEN